MEYEIEYFQSFVSRISYNGELDDVVSPYESESTQILQSVLPPNSSINIVSEVIMGFEVSDKCFEMMKEQGKTELSDNPKSAFARFTSHDGHIEVNMFLNTSNMVYEVQLDNLDKNYLIEKVDSALSIERNGITIKDLLSKKMIDISRSRTMDYNYSKER